MKPFVVKPVSRLKGKISLPGDKSITHRYIIISSLSQGLTRIKNLPLSKDCNYTQKAFKKLGIKITFQCSKKYKRIPEVSIMGSGLLGLKKPAGPVSVGNSGTTLRLLLGVLAGQGFKVTLRAGRSLSRRPMLRVTKPLRMMGARIKARVIKYKPGLPSEDYPPITIKGGNLSPINYTLPVASAQVKSAILLAALYAKGTTKITEPVKTRDHTERLLKLFKARIKTKGNTIVVEGSRELVSPGTVTIPGDISSAAFFIALATIIPNSQILLRNISLNPSRLGIIRVLKRMGGNIRFSKADSGLLAVEPAGDILVASSSLKGTIVRKKEIPSLIDELPVLMVAASYSRGETVFEDVGELRVKETDRIRSMSENLREMGADVKVLRVSGSEKIIIQGDRRLKGARVRSFGDHRTAMSMIVAGLAATGETKIDDISCINKSFPDFIYHLRSLIR